MKCAQINLNWEPVSYIYNNVGNLNPSPTQIPQQVVHMAHLGHVGGLVGVN